MSLLTPRSHPYDQQHQLQPSLDQTFTHLNQPLSPGFSSPSSPPSRSSSSPLPSSGGSFSPSSFTLTAPPKSDIHATPVPAARNEGNRRGRGRGRCNFSAPLSYAAVPRRRFVSARVSLEYEPCLQYDHAGLVFMIPPPGVGGEEEREGQEGGAAWERDRMEGMDGGVVGGGKQSHLDSSSQTRARLEARAGRGTAWVKAGLEAKDGQVWLSVVTKTRDGWCDWSLGELPFSCMSAARPLPQPELPMPQRPTQTNHAQLPLTPLTPLSSSPPPMVSVSGHEEYQTYLSLPSPSPVPMDVDIPNTLPPPPLSLPLPLPSPAYQEDSDYSDSDEGSGSGRSQAGDGSSTSSIGGGGNSCRTRAFFRKDPGLDNGRGLEVDVVKPGEEDPTLLHRDHHQGLRHARSLWSLRSSRSRQSLQQQQQQQQQQQGGHHSLPSPSLTSPPSLHSLSQPRSTPSLLSPTRSSQSLRGHPSLPSPWRQQHGQLLEEDEERSAAGRTASATIVLTRSRNALLVEFEHPPAPRPRTLTPPGGHHHQLQPPPLSPASPVSPPSAPLRRTLLRKVPWVFLDEDEDDEDDDDDDSDYEVVDLEDAEGSGGGGGAPPRGARHRDRYPTAWVGAFAARPDPEDHAAAAAAETGSSALEVRFRGLSVEVE